MVWGFSNSPAFDMTTRTEAAGIVKNGVLVGHGLEEINNATAQLIVGIAPANDGFE